MKPEEVISEVVKSVMELAKPGINLLELETRAETTIQLYGATSANKGYHPMWSQSPFPSVICLGVNDMIAHGIPYDYTLKDGDLLTIDCGITVDNRAGDCGITVPIGKVSDRDERLLRYTRRTLYEGIRQIKPGAPITEPGRAMEKFARMSGFVLNKLMTGHTIGEHMHEEPAIPNHYIGREEIVTVDANGKKKYSYKDYENIPTFYEGQIVCLEPMLTYDDTRGTLDKDGWTVRTRNGKNSAFAEHMIKVVTGGYQVLTNHIIYE